jgi:hypothetical protein
VSILLRAYITTCLSPRDLLKKPRIAHQRDAMRYPKTPLLPKPTPSQHIQ